MGNKFDEAVNAAAEEFAATPTETKKEIEPADDELHDAELSDEEPDETAQAEATPDELAEYKALGMSPKEIKEMLAEKSAAPPPSQGTDMSALARLARSDAHSALAYLQSLDGGPVTARESSYDDSSEDDMSGRLKRLEQTVNATAYQQIHGKISSVVDGLVGKHPIFKEIGEADDAAKSVVASLVSDPTLTTDNVRAKANALVGDLAKRATAKRDGIIKSYRASKKKTAAQSAPPSYGPSAGTKSQVPTHQNGRRLTKWDQAEIEAVEYERRLKRSF